MTADTEYSINISEKQNKLCLSLHSNGSKSFLFVNRVKICQFKAKDFPLNACPLCSGNIQKILQLITLRKLDFMDTFVIFQLISIVLVLMIFWIYKYLMRQHNIKQ